jgi:energy-coupling factor transporter ATP-binding protein EcfA2
MKGITIKSLNYTYPNGVNALKGIDLYISPGEIVGIMGRNGAGKSTFMKLLNGMLHPSTGIILIDGLSTIEYDSSLLTSKVGVMMQNPDHQLFCSTVEEEINFSLKNLKLSKQEFNDYKSEIIKKLSLKPLLNRSPFNLSGGERKKVSIASVLCRKPDYVLFDEPTVGQDQKQRRVLEKLIKNEMKLGKTVIIITHDTEFIYRTTNRIIVFDDGKIVADGPTNKILSNKQILDRSSLIEPQFIKFKRMMLESIDEEYKKKIKIDISKLNDFESLKKELIGLMEGR